MYIREIQIKKNNKFTVLYVYIIVKVFKAFGITDIRRAVSDIFAIEIGPIDSR